MRTSKELLEIAKEKKVKHRNRYKKHELEKILELEKTDPAAFYKKYCKGKREVIPVLVKNDRTGEEKVFKSLYATGKYFNIWPATVKWRILERKKMKTGFGDFWEFSYIHHNK